MTRFMLETVAGSHTKNWILWMLEEPDVDVKATDENGNTVLHLLVQNYKLSEKDCIELLENFLDRGVDPNFANKNKQTVLHRAVARKMRAAVDFLISRKANVDVCDKKGNSLAHFFVKEEGEKSQTSLKLEEESASFAEFMISRGFDFDRRNHKGICALLLAIKYNLQHILPALLKHTKNISYVNKRNKTLLHLFLEKREEGRREFSGEKWYLERTNHYAVDIVKTLLDRGVPLLVMDDKNRLALQTAIQAGESMLIVEMIGDRVIEVCTDSDLATFLFYRLIGMCPWWQNSGLDYFLYMLRTLIARGAVVDGKDGNGVTAAYIAIFSKNLKLVELLNEHSIDFGAVVITGDTLLHALAALEPRHKSVNSEDLEKMFWLLVSEGCELNARNVYNETPLHLTARDENLTIARKLIELGAEVNSRDNKKLTPLHCAVKFNEKEDLTMLLLENGAHVNVNSRDSFNRRPIFYAAASEKKSSLVPLLLKWGAYADVYTFGESAFGAALSRDRANDVKEMLKYGADVNEERLNRLILESEPFTASKDLLVQHWIKLKAANLSGSKAYEAFAEKGKYQTFYQDCLREIEKLKSKFTNDQISLYDFLRMDKVSRRIQINNEKLKKIINDPKLENQFPKYSDVILASYRETVFWKPLVEPAKRAWLEITGLALPDICLEQIFSFLNVEDLVHMVEYDEVLQ